MPLVKKEITLAAGATSEQVLAGTTYEYVGPNTRLVIAATSNTSDGVAAGNTFTDVDLNFNVNNAEFARGAKVTGYSPGEPFGWRGSYVMNDMVTTAIERNRPIITFTNNSGVTQYVQVAVFIGG